MDSSCIATANRSVQYELLHTSLMILLQSTDFTYLQSYSWKRGADKKNSLRIRHHGLKIVLCFEVCTFLLILISIFIISD